MNLSGANLYYEQKKKLETTRHFVTDNVRSEIKM